MRPRIFEGLLSLLDGVLSPVMEVLLQVCYALGFIVGFYQLYPRGGGDDPSQTQEG